MFYRGSILLLACVQTSAYLLHNPSSSSLETSREKRQLRHHEWRRHLWNRDQVIKYTFNDSLVEQKIPFVRETIEYYSKLTCLNFEHTPGQDYDFLIATKIGARCSSEVGAEKINTVNGTIERGVLSLDFDLCVKNDGITSLIHEIQHLYGLLHTHQSIKAKEFFKVANSKIEKDRPNWVEQPFARYLGLPLDTGSLMMYASANDSMLTREQYRNNFCNAYPPFSDLRLVNLMYKCPDLCDPEDLFRCSTFLGIPDSRNCSTCICPNGFEGPSCTDRRKSSFGHPPCGDTLMATDQPQILSINISKSRNLDDWNNGIYKFLAPNVCVWHIKAPDGKKLSLKVSGNIADYDHNQQEQYARNRFNYCHRANLEIQVDNFDLAGYRYCSDLDIDEVPALISDNNFAVVIATSALDVLLPLNVTYFAID